MRTKPQTELGVQNRLAQEASHRERRRPRTVGLRQSRDSGLPRRDVAMAVDRPRDECRIRMRFLRSHDGVSSLPFGELQALLEVQAQARPDDRSALPRTARRSTSERNASATEPGSNAATRRSSTGSFVRRSAATPTAPRVATANDSAATTSSRSPAAARTSPATSGSSASAATLDEGTSRSLVSGTVERPANRRLKRRISHRDWGAGRIRAHATDQPGGLADIFDDLDELVDAVSVLPRELDECSCLGDDESSLRCAGDFDSASAAELE
jgi:hypothetical protein